MTQFNFSVKPKSRSVPAGNCGKQKNVKLTPVNVTVETDEAKIVARNAPSRALDDESNVSDGSKANLAKYGLLFYANVLFNLIV